MIKGICKKAKELFILNQKEFIAAPIAIFIVILIWIFTDATTVIAVCAMIATGWQAWISRVHNKLSVRPNLIRYANRDRATPVILGIANHGLGPAIIEDIIFSYDNQDYSFVNGDLQRKLEEIVQDSGLKFNLHHIAKNVFLPIGEKVNLIQIKNSNENDQNHNNALKLIGDLKFKLAYKSIYDEKFCH